MKYRRNSLEARALDLLRPFSLHHSTRYTIRAHELTHDGTGWSSNDRWTIARDTDLAGALEAIRGRWETFRVNYAARARVQDLDAPHERHRFADQVLDHWEAAGLPFLDIEAEGPLVTLFDQVRDADSLDLEAIAADLDKARRECTEEEYPAALHSARLEALDQLKA